MLRILQLGDTFHEGHCITETYVVDVTTDVDVLDHYELAQQAFGLDILDRCTNDDNILTLDEYELIKGFLVGCDKFDYDIDGDEVSITSGAYVRIFIGIFNSLDPNVVMTLLDVPVVDIGGHELFSN